MIPKKAVPQKITEALVSRTAFRRKLQELAGIKSPTFALIFS